MSGPRERRGSKAVSWKKFLPLALVSAGAAAFFALGLDDYLTFEALSEHRAALSQWVESFGLLAAALFAVAYAALIALSIPVGAIATLTSGFLFGAIGGTIVAAAGASLGAIAIFLIAKSALGEPLRRRAGPRLRRLEAGFQGNAFNYMLVLRLVPLFPFWLVNLAPAFLGIRLSTYALSTAIGILPGALVYASVGGGLGAVLDAGGKPDLGIVFRPEILLPLLGLAALALLPVGYRWSLARNERERAQMKADPLAMPAPLKGLSARLLGLTILFVMLAEVLIYVPSIAEHRRDLLNRHLAAAQIATLALEATPDNMVSPDLERELLANAGVRAVILRRAASRMLMLNEDMPVSVAAEYDLRGVGAFSLIVDAFATLARQGDTTIRVIGFPREQAGEYLEIVLREAPLRTAMLQYSANILSLSIIISLITASLLYGSVHILLVRPIRKLADSMVRFRDAPEDASRALAPTERGDEIGMAMRALAAMQAELRTALQQKTHLANLGVAVSKINHDLRNILASAQLVSDRLASLDDPAVKRLAPSLIASIDRAISLCRHTLEYGRAEEGPPEPERFLLAPLVEHVRVSLGLEACERVQWRTEVDPKLAVYADEEHLFRALLNLCRNAVQAIEGDGRIVVVAWPVAGGGAVIEVRDTGPGLPAHAREHLFEPFRGGARAGGVGLGLTVARDLMRAHGGDLVLVKSDEWGATFQISLPGPHE